MSNDFLKPNWLKIKIFSDFNQVNRIKHILYKRNLHTVCEEAACPNLYECFNRGTATFMILGRNCTRKCPFCNVNHGRPENVNINEPVELAEAVKEMKLQYIVITSVNRDDLYDGGANHFVQCIRAIRKTNFSVKIEILVPDFRNCVDHALEIINTSPPDIFNHNIESVPRIYQLVRPGANYNLSLKLLEKYRNSNPNCPTKSGFMVGLGETKDEIFRMMYDLYSHGVSMLTVGQYLRPSKNHLPVKRYFELNEFQEIREKALSIGFTQAFCGPLVRSSYHADLQAKEIRS